MLNSLMHRHSLGHGLIVQKRLWTTKKKRNFCLWAYKNVLLSAVSSLVFVIKILKTHQQHQKQSLLLFNHVDTVVVLQ